MKTTESCSLFSKHFFFLLCSHRSFIYIYIFKMLYQSAQKDKCLQQAMNNTNEKNKINTKKKDK